jgi:hypothetical protein
MTPDPNIQSIPSPTLLPEETVEEGSIPISRTVGASPAWHAAGKRKPSLNELDRMGPSALTRLNRTLK